MATSSFSACDPPWPPDLSSAVRDLTQSSDLCDDLSSSPSPFAYSGSVGHKA
ncbi:unnamed protein product [Brassica rapa subsp. trilocularis]